MKLHKIRILMCFALVFCLFTGAAQAATQVKDGMEISLEAEQPAYEAGETIEVTLTVKNAGNQQIHLSSVQWEAPQELTAIQEKNGFMSKALVHNDVYKQTMAFRSLKTAAPALPQTGDDSALLLWGALLAASVVGYVCLKPTARKRMLGLVLCIILLGSMLPEIRPAKAEEAYFADEEEVAAEEIADKEIRQLAISETVTVAGKPMQLTVTIRYNDEDVHERAALGKTKNLKQKTTASGLVNLSWSKVSNATGYEVYYRIGTSGSFTKYGTTPATNITLNKLPDAANKAAKLYVKVRAYRKSGSKTTYGAYSNVLVANPVSVRALYIVEETYPNQDPLPTYSADLSKLKNTFSAGSPYGRPVIKTATYRNQSKAQIKSRIATAAGWADANDVTIFYLATRGNHRITTGANAGRMKLSDGNDMTFAELAKELKKIPGRVVVMLAGSGSGSSIGKSGSTAESNWNQEAISAFAAEDEQLILDDQAMGEKVGELRVNSKFYVLTSCQGGGSGYFDASEGSYLLQWIRQGVWAADTNGNKSITLAEMETYLKNKGNSTWISYYYRMHPQVYPSNSTFPLIQKTQTTAAMSLGQTNNLRQKTTESGLLNISWDKVSNATGYEVYYRTTTNSSFVKYGITTSTNITLKNLPVAADQSTKLYVKVRAYRSNNGTKSYGAYSSVFTANPVSVRALYIIEETWPSSPPIYIFDVEIPRMKNLFKSASPYGRPVIATYYFRDQTKAQIKNRIAAMANLADNNDVTVFYLVTHGALHYSDGTLTRDEDTGMLYLSDGSWMKYKELAKDLKTIPGRVFILLGSCGSGSSIGKAVETNLNQMFIEAIASEDQLVITEETTSSEKANELCVKNKFYVIAAAQGGHVAYPDAVGGHTLTKWMTEGLWMADSDKNGTITLSEMAAYLTQRGNNEWIYYDGKVDKMHPQVYPTNSSFPLFQKR